MHRYSCGQDWLPATLNLSAGGVISSTGRSIITIPKQPPRFQSGCWWLGNGYAPHPRRATVTWERDSGNLAAGRLNGNIVRHFMARAPVQNL